MRVEGREEEWYHLRTFLQLSVYFGFPICLPIAMDVGIVGYGFVGKAVSHNLAERLSVSVYDPYTEVVEEVKQVHSLGELERCHTIFICLPTPYSSESGDYDYTAIEETLNDLAELNGNIGRLIVIKSTVAPDFYRQVCQRYPQLNILHNPEFLSARTAHNDFKFQSHIVIGSGSKQLNNRLAELYRQFPQWRDIKYTLVSGEEACLIKMACNSFYAYKLTYFNSLYQLAESLGCDYNHVREGMINCGWINSQHTRVPGNGGRFGYGGGCLVKDTDSFCGLLSRRGLNYPRDILVDIATYNRQLRKKKED